MTTKTAKPARRSRRTESEPFRLKECPRLVLARRLDMLAGAELQHGHVIAAEQLAWRAAAVRGCSG